MAQTFGFMLYVLGLGLGLAICVLDSITCGVYAYLGLRSKSMVQGLRGVLCATRCPLILTADPGSTY